MSRPPEGEINIDVDRDTGWTIWGWPVVAQSIRELILTQEQSRVLREWIGSRVVAALGRNLTEETVLRVYTAIAMIIDLYEPRFSIRRFEAATTDARSGELRLRIVGDYLPRALTGDDTPDGEQRRIEVQP